MLIARLVRREGVGQAVARGEQGPRSQGHCLAQGTHAPRGQDARGGGPFRYHIL